MASRRERHGGRLVRRERRDPPKQRSGDDGAEPAVDKAFNRLRRADDGAIFVLRKSLPKTDCMMSLICDQHEQAKRTQHARLALEPPAVATLTPES